MEMEGTISTSVNEANELNTSVEDVLGTHTLYVSGSDDGEGEQSVKKLTKQLGDNSNDDHIIKNFNGKEIPKENSVQVEAAVDNRLIDVCVTQKHTDQHNRVINSDEDSNSDDDSGNKPKEEKSVRPKTRLILDSESEAESDADHESQSAIDNSKNSNSNISKLIDSDSERDKNSELEFAESDEKDTKRKLKSKNLKKKIQKPKYAGLVDSESESENNSDCDKQTKLDNNNETELKLSDHAENETASAKRRANDKRKNSKVMRASAKKALNAMQTIQSEQQRLHREATISIPYHKPKRHTLQEFLQRRTIMRPEVQGEGSAVTGVVQSKNLKMTPEELEEYAKLMDERAKEATDFFKSESEEDERPDSVDQMGVLPTNLEEPMPEEQPLSVSDNKKDHDIEVNVTAVNSTPIESVDLLNVDEPIGEVNANVEAIKVDEILKESLHWKTSNDAEPSVSCKAVITEVITLPKLDMSGIIQHIPEKDIKESPIQSPLWPAENVNNFKNIKRLLLEKNLCDSPTLKGDPDMVINLETGDMIKKQPSGVDHLLSRLLAASKVKKSDKPKTLNVLSTENGKLEMSTVTLHTPEELDMHNHKPRATYFELKQKLKDIITKKRREEMQKKLKEDNDNSKLLEDEYDEEEYEEYEPELKPTDVVIDDEENINMEATDDYDGNYDDADNVSDKTKSDRDDDEEDIIDFDNNDDEIEQNDSDENREEVNNVEDDTMASEANVDFVQNEIAPRKSRIIKSFLDDSDDDECGTGYNFLDSQPLQQAQSYKVAALFEPETEKALSDVESELMGLCSGQFFGDTQKSQLPLISQIPATQFNPNRDPTDELLDLCSGTFDSNSESLRATQEEQGMLTTALTGQGNKILSSEDEKIDDSFEEDTNLDTHRRNKKFTKKQSKKKMNLVFSEDEDDDDEIDTIDNVDDIFLSSPAKEMKEDNEVISDTFIDYDSEENEIVVKMTKEECVKQAQKFVENEAELSESEWGSADEDERNLDKYDIELGDEDEFDREKLQTELGKIHARKMLDDDIKEVRKIQELLFEDEENDGVGRQRQFRWKNAETGFSLDNKERGNDAGSGAESEDEENEHLWRKIRFEREQLFKEKGLRLREDKQLSTYLASSTGTISNTSTIAPSKKINIVTAKKTTTSIEVKQSSPFLICKESTELNKKTSRGSFLVRDKETLTKLAEFTKSEVDFNSIIDTAGTVSVKAKKSKNFVFTTLTETEHELLKRKSKELLDNNTEIGINYMKKPRMETYKDKCLIDHLQ